jgi:hypothetical protein
MELILITLCNGLLAEMSGIALHFIKIGAVQTGDWKRIRIRQRLSPDSLSLSLTMCVTLVKREVEK